MKKKGWPYSSPWLLPAHLRKFSTILFAVLRNRFSERGLVDVSATICWENYLTRFNRTFTVRGHLIRRGRPKWS